MPAALVLSFQSEKYCMKLVNLYLTLIVFMFHGLVICGVHSAELPASLEGEPPTDISSAVNSVTGKNAQQTGTGRINVSIPVNKKAKNNVSIFNYTKTLAMTDCQTKEFNKFKKEHPEATDSEMNKASKRITVLCTKRIKHTATENKKLSGEKLKRLNSHGSGKVNQSIPVSRALNAAEATEKE